MAWYYSRDNRQAGPMAWEAIVQSARTGQLRPQDFVWTAGMAQWVPASTVEGLFTPGAAPPAPPGPAARPAGEDAVMRALLPVGRSGWAIAAGYLGLLSPLVIFAPFALLTGIIAIWDMRRHPEKHGMVRAVLGIVMGGLVCAVLLYVLLTRR